MSKKELISLTILVLVISYGAYKYFGRSYVAEKMNPNLLNTAVSIKGESKNKNINTQIDSVFTYIKALESKLNDYDPNSWISRLNSAGGNPFPMDPDAYAVLCIADSLYKMTDGMFDISIKPLYELWGFSRIEGNLLTGDETSPPDSTDIIKTIKRIGFNRVKYNSKSITMPADMQISFGAIAKGYALDKAREYMLGHNFLSGNIDCISSITFFGRSIPEVVGIMHPRAALANKEMLGSFRIKNGSVSTSGDYQLYFEYGGKRYHHILNPKTGYPVESIYSVTVINPSAAWADGLSTALYLLPPERALKELDRYPDSHAVIYYQSSNEVVALISKGMKKLDWRAE